MKKNWRWFVLLLLVCLPASFGGFECDIDDDDDDIEIDFKAVRWVLSNESVTHN